MTNLSEKQNHLTECDAVRDALLSLLDDQGGQNDSQAYIVSHLEACVACRAYREQLASGIGMLKSAAGFEAGFELPDAFDLSDRIMAHVAEHEGPFDRNQKPTQSAKGNTKNNVVPLERQYAFRWGALVAAIALLVMAFPLMKSYFGGQEQIAKVPVNSMALDENTLSYIAKAESDFDMLSGISDGEPTRYADPIEDLVGF